ncbi:potassium channel family protein [Salinibaculum rarum]|uniref:potassium channel family protein n=1 Tax=Salinibaculum rarum TaxID=3058903 RepID=UPI00265FCA9A|nr:TrkA family potassium uptake protein [Salinibaculum sp. KK48]
MDGNFRVVIAGGGRVGRRVAHLLDDRGHDVVVIEADAERADEISDEYVATVITGDAARPTILEQADLDRTDVVAALTNDTGTNLAIGMMVKDMGTDVQTVVRTEREAGNEFDRFVDEVIFPERAGARAAVNAIESDVSSLADVTGELDILEVHVAEGAPVAGKTLSDIALPTGSLFVSDAAGNTIAGPETVLEPGESYVVAAEPAVIDEVMNLMRG